MLRNFVLRERMHKILTIGDNHIPLLVASVNTPLSTKIISQAVRKCRFRNNLYPLYFFRMCCFVCFILVFVYLSPMLKAVFCKSFLWRFSSRVFFSQFMSTPHFRIEKVLQ